MTDKTDSKERDLMELVDAYAEARHIGGCHTYNAKAAEARNAVIASLAQSGFDAADMATAEARGFRDGVASLAASAGSEPVAWRYADARGHFRYVGYKPGRNMAAEYPMLKPHPLYLHPSPPEGMVGGWISVEDARKPPPGKPVVLWVWGERYQEDDDGRQIAQDASGLHLGEWREAEHGNYFDNYSTPFADREAVLWWMDPAPPTTSAGSGKGE